MATIASPAAARLRGDRLFYSAMGLAIAGTVLWGFSASFYLSHWLTPPATAPRIGLLLGLHAAAFTGWLALMVVQPLLIATRNAPLHRRLGMAGAALAAAMVVLGNLTAIAALHGGFRAVPDPYVFYAIPFFAIQNFAVIVYLAIRWRNRAETHKRLILLANVAILGAAFGRIPLALIHDHAPIVPFFSPDLIILAGIVYDWLSRGRVHRVWTIGGGFLLASQIATLAVMGTGAWHRFAETMAGLWPA